MNKSENLPLASKNRARNETNNQYENTKYLKCNNQQIQLNNPLRRPKYEIDFQMPSADKTEKRPARLFPKKVPEDAATLPNAGAKPAIRPEPQKARSKDV